MPGGWSTTHRTCKYLLYSLTPFTRSSNHDVVAIVTLAPLRGQPGAFDGIAGIARAFLRAVQYDDRITLSDRQRRTRCGLGFTRGFLGAGENQHQAAACGQRSTHRICTATTCS